MNIGLCHNNNCLLQENLPSAWKELSQKSSPEFKICRKFCLYALIVMKINVINVCINALCARTVMTR
jgi:hypothetical protein